MTNICSSRRAFLGGTIGLAASAALALPKEKPLFTIGLLCDTHVGGPAMDPVTKKRKVIGCERVKMALEVFRRQGCDIVANVGDVCDMHDPELYPKIRATAEAVFAGAEKRPKLWYVYAGHDVFRFRGHDRTKFMEDRMPALDEMRDLIGAENPQKVWVTDVKGVPVVLFREWSDKDDRYGDVLKDVCAKNPGKPVLVLDHYPPFDTVSKSDNNGGYIRRRTILDGFPQVIHISGHLHNTMRDPGQIWQGAFTAYNCGCLYDWSRPLAGGSRSEILQGWEVSLLEMYPSAVVFRRFDIRTGAEIDPLAPWTVPLPFDPKTAPFRREARRRAESVPAFPRGAQLAVAVDLPKTGVTLSFPSAPGTYGYRVETFRKAPDGAWARFSLREELGDYCLPDGTAPSVVTHLLPASLLAGESACRVTVTPQTAFGSCGAPIEAAFAVPALPAAGETVYASDDPLAELEVRPWDAKTAPFAKSADGWLAIPAATCNGFGRLVLPEKAFASPVGTHYRIDCEFRVDGPACDHLQLNLTAPAGGRYISDRIRVPMGTPDAQRVIIDWTSTEKIPVPVLSLLSFAKWTPGKHDFRLRFDRLRILRLPAKVSKA